MLRGFQNVVSKEHTFAVAVAPGPEVMAGARHASASARSLKGAAHGCGAQSSRGGHGQRHDEDCMLETYIISIMSFEARAVQAGQYTLPLTCILPHKHRG